MTKKIDEAQEWEYWNKRKTFRIYEAFWLNEWKRFPPRNKSSLTDRDYHDIEDMAEYNDKFEKLCDSLRGDKTEGKDFRSKSNLSITTSYIEKKSFIEHWKKCGFNFHENFSLSKKGRIPLVDTNELKKIAYEQALNKSYIEFVIIAKNRFGCDSKTIKNNFLKRDYDSLVKSSRIPKTTI